MLDDDDVVILEDEDAEEEVLEKSNVDKLIQENEKSLQNNEEVCSTNDTCVDESPAHESAAKEHLEISGSRTIHECQLCDKVS